jgi:hypothetical protein
MLEARPQFTDPDDFYAWVRRNFKIGREQAQAYMKAADATKYEALQKKDSDDLHRRLFGDKREPIRPGIDAAAAAARRDNYIAEQRARVDKYEAQKALVKQMLDIGYKALATKLHSDKGGSAEGMQRLHAVRNRVRKENRL